jgi:Ca-activated chloride channel homolog
MTFLNPEFLWLFLLIPLAIAWFYWKRFEQNATLKISSTKGFGSSNSWIVKLKPILYLLRILALSSIIIALARPRVVNISNERRRYCFGH